MTLIFFSYLAGVLTIAAPCIFPILPFFLSRADEPFFRSGFPMLLGLAVTFTVVATLTSFAGGWAIGANEIARTVALVCLTVFGLTLMLPHLATRLTRPFVLSGAWLSQVAARHPSHSILSSFLVGAATGLVWAPCAGPLLGLILTGAALNGASLQTSVLLLAYGCGAASSLAAGMMLSRQLFHIARKFLGLGEALRRLLGAAAVGCALAIWSGIDARALANWSSVATTHIEQQLVDTLREEDVVSALNAEPTHITLSGPLSAVLKPKQWLNSSPLEPKDLAGKVVLINFWTYSCINCIRVLPHLREWAAKYQDRGLVVIGVHTPEFAFEKSPENVKQAAAALSVAYPVALDSDFGVWRAFGNYAWPALYFVDSKGHIRNRVLGEGSYDQSERLIQTLLSEVDGKKSTSDLTLSRASGVQASPDEANLQSGETYIGFAKATNFLSPGGLRPDSPNQYRMAASLPLNAWSLSGNWSVGAEYGTLVQPSGAIRFRFHARDLHLVLAPPSSELPVRFRVTIDGALPGESHGSDTDADGWGTVTDDRLYQLVRQVGPVDDRTFQIQFFDRGVRAYAFTFG